MERTYAGFAVAAILTAGLVAAAVLARPAARAEAPVLAVDPAVPEHELLEDALQIAYDRQAGHFAYVPGTRPPGLLRMTPGRGGAPVTDSYRIGQQKLYTVVELSPTATDTCELIREGQLSSSLCVRETTLDAPGPHVTVYFTGDVGDPEAARAARFWAEAEFVPLERAAWFQDLVARGRAATRA